MALVLKGLFVVAGFASLIAIADWPYGYYIMLKGLVSVSAALLAVLAVKNGQLGWLLLAVPSFFLWFLLIGVEMDKDSWAILNLAAGVGFIAASKFFKTTATNQ